MATIEDVKSLIENVEDDIAASKTVVEKSDEYTPTLAFYKNSQDRSIIASVSNGKDLSETLQNICEALYLYVYTDSYACVLSMTSNIIIDDKSYNALMLYVLSPSSAWIITIPYDKQDDVTWYNDLMEVTPVDEQEFDDQGKDMITSLYVYVQNIVPSNMFSIEDIFSYLSTTNAAIKIVDETSYSYFDFSAESSMMV